MSKTMGDTININHEFHEKLYISVIPENIICYWPKASEVANFVADFFYHDSPDRATRNNISTILNELIENAVKFSSVKKHQVDIYTFHNATELVFQITNTISPEAWNELEKVYHEMENRDLKELYIQRIRDLNRKKSGTGIGLILLKKDYRIEINFALDHNHEAGDLLTTTARMRVA